MTAWMAAIIAGFIAVGLNARRSSQSQHWLIIVIVAIVIGFEAVSIHAL